MFHLPAANEYRIELLKGVEIVDDINISEVSGGVIEYILISTPNIGNRLSQNLYEGLSSLPLIGKTVTFLESAISECSMHTNLKELLKTNKDAADLIKAICCTDLYVEPQLPDVYDTTRSPSTKACRNPKTEEMFDEGLSIITNVESNLVAIYNLTGQAGVILDLNADLITISNGSSRTDIVIKIKDRTGAYVSSIEPALTAENFRDYLTSLKNGLSPLLSEKNAITFKIDSIPELILQSVNRVLEYILDNISEELKVNPKSPLELTLVIGDELIGFYEGGLKGGVKQTGIQGITIRGDLARTVNVQKGAATTFGAVSGGLPGLIKAGATIDFQKLSHVKNGIESLTLIIDGIGSTTYAVLELRDLLNDPESLFKLLTLLGGSTSKDVNGVLKVVATLIEFSKKETSLEKVINTIIQFLTVNSRDDNDPEEISSNLKQGIFDLIKAIKKAGRSDSLQRAVEVTTSLAEDHLELNGIRISAILSKLFSSINKPKKLQVLVEILVELQDIIKTDESLPRLLLVLILNVDNPLGIQLLKGVGIVDDINISEVSGGVIEYILISTPNIGNRLSQNLYEGLGSLPLIRKTVTSLESAISESGMQTNLKELLTTNKDAADLIRGIFKVVGGLNLEVPDDASSRVREIVDECCSLNFYLSADVETIIAA